MKTVLAAILLSLVCATAPAQDVLSALPRPTRSQSELFLAYPVPGTRGPVDHSFYLRNNTNLIQLEPWVLVVSCERIKDELWREFNITAPSRAKIYLCLYRANSVDDPIAITPRLQADGWSYRVDLPDLISRSHYLSAMTHILLLELANRNADRRSAEIPLWLREGLAQHILGNREAEFIPRIPQLNVNGMTVSPLLIEGRRANPLAHAHDVLLASPPLTFEELSWPSSDNLRGDSIEQFRSSAQLFVTRLLSMQNGHDSMRNMIASLPQYYNWQLALLNAYQKQFVNTRDIEKWWAMTVVQFTGHDLAQTWTAAASLQRLEETIRPGVEVRTATNQMPLHTDASLQTIISDWKKSQRDDTLQQVVNELAVLKLRLAPTVAAVADKYQNTLMGYLRNLDQFDNVLDSRGHSGLTEASLTRSTLKTLDALDAQRIALRPKPKRLPTNNASASLDTIGIKPIVQ